MNMRVKRGQIVFGTATLAVVLAVTSVASACVATTVENKLKIRDPFTGAEVRSASAGDLLRATGELIERPWPYQIKLFVDPLRADGDQGYYDGTTDALRRRCGDTGIPQVVAQATPMNLNYPTALFGHKFDALFVLDPGPLPGHAHFCANPVWNKEGGTVGGFLENYVYSPFDVSVL